MHHENRTYSEESSFNCWNSKRKLKNWLGDDWWIFCEYMSKKLTLSPYQWPLDFWRWTIFPFFILSYGSMTWDWAGPWPSVLERLFDSFPCACVNIHLRAPTRMHTRMRVSDFLPLTAPWPLSEIPSNKTHNCFTGSSEHTMYTRKFWRKIGCFRYYDCLTKVFLEAWFQLCLQTPLLQIHRPGHTLVSTRLSPLLYSGLWMSPYRGGSTPSPSLSVPSPCLIGFYTISHHCHIVYLVMYWLSHPTRKSDLVYSWCLPGT